jgi:chromosome segregation ATPase
MQSSIVFDTNSGFSLDEQKKILTDIDSAVKPERLDDTGEKAKKKGALFPALVNVAALVLLAGGLFGLWRLQQSAGASIRLTGSAGTLAERAIINAISAKQASAAVKKNTSNAANSRAQATADKQSATVKALEALQNGQEEAAGIEAQFNGFLQNLNAEVAAGSWEEAEKTLTAARTFLATPAFADNKLFTERKNIYEASLQALQQAVGAASGTSIQDMQQQMAAMQQQAADASAMADAAAKEKQTAAANAEQTIKEQQNLIAGLKNQVASQKSQISSLDTKVTSLNKQVSSLQTAGGEKDKQIAALKTQAQKLINQQISNLQSASEALQGSPSKNAAKQ